MDNRLLYDFGCYFECSTWVVRAERRIVPEICYLVKAGDPFSQHVAITNHRARLLTVYNQMFTRLVSRLIPPFLGFHPRGYMMLASRNYCETHRQPYQTFLNPSSFPFK